MTKYDQSTAQRVAIFEKMNDLNLPTQYKLAVVHGHLGRYRHWMHEFTGIDGFDEDVNVTTFLSFMDDDRHSVPAMYRFYSLGGRISACAVPIASTAVGDLICIDMSREHYGDICYWDHELDLVLEANEFMGALAPGLARILNIFRRDGRSQGRRATDQSPGINSRAVWISPEANAMYSMA